MNDSTIVSAVDVGLWVASATRYPLSGSDIKERFLRLAASHEQLQDALVFREREVRKLTDDVATLKAALKAKGGRKR